MLIYTIRGTMITQRPLRIAFIAFLAWSACGHPPLSPSGAFPSAEAEAVGYGVEGAPLPDGSYAILSSDPSFRREGLQVDKGRLSLFPGNTENFDYEGKGPLWHLHKKGDRDRAFEADLLMINKDRGWIFQKGEAQGTQIVKLSNLPASLQRDWVPVPNISKELRSIESIVLSSEEGTVIPKGAPNLPFSTAYLQNRGDIQPNLLVTTEGRATYLSLVAHQGLLGVSAPGEGHALFVDRRAANLPAITLDQLRGQPLIYFTGRETYDLKCGNGGCDLVDWETTHPPIHLKTVNAQPRFLLRLRQGDSDAKDIVLVPMSSRVLALGKIPEAVLLSPVAISKIPPELLGAWRTSVVFPLDGFDIAEIHIGKGGATTRRTRGSDLPAYLVQSAYDDGLLLLEHRQDSPHWNLWRLTQGHHRWYLSRWIDGAGPVALWQGAEPTWSPAFTAQNARSGQIVSGVEGKVTEAQAGWRSLDKTTKKAATTALNAMWLGAVVFYESYAVSSADVRARARFPGKNTYAFTPDGCKKSGAGPSTATWQREPWRSLNFMPPENAGWMGFDFISDGEGPTAHFVAIVAIDSDCSGKPVYVWRRGRINTTGDVEGGYVPESGYLPPGLEALEGMNGQ